MFYDLREQVIFLVTGYESLLNIVASHSCTVTRNSAFLILYSFKRFLKPFKKII